jgi:Zn-dependent membrane protease YugP
MMWGWFDPMYFLFLAPGMLLAMWAQFRVQSAFNRASQVPAQSGFSGAETADHLLKAAGVSDVRIEPTEGFLSDHYAPGQHVLRLSPGVYDGRSLAALGIAAHESGHALQEATRYPLMGIRNGLVPLANIGGTVSMVVIGIGFLLASMNFIMLGIIAFSTTVVFQLVNLPVEFDASRRARQELLRTGLLSPQEEPEVASVLNAAALTYVAATLTSILTLLYFLFRAGLLGGSSRDD